MRKKMARWWNRLGGKPVGHAASPRSKAPKELYFISPTGKKTLINEKTSSPKTGKKPKKLPLGRLTTHIKHQYTSSEDKMQAKNYCFLGFFEAKTGLRNLMRGAKWLEYSGFLA
jgi:hypothetical protein